MLMSFMLGQKYLWPIPFILQALAYIGVLGKMNIPIRFAFIPGGADYQITKRLYPKTRTFWRPFFVASLLVLAAFYINPFVGSGKTVARIFLFIAIVVYLVFLLRLYRRLSKAFGHGIPFALLLFLIPPLGLAILGFGKSQYLGDPVFKPAKQHGIVLRSLGRVAFLGISLVEALALIAVVGFFVLQTHQPTILIRAIQDEYTEKTKDIVGGESLITNEDALGEAAGKLASLPASREKFFADHSQDENVVVLAYMLGSDLEDRGGLATFNIKQMREATKQGSNLSFVLETGGSRRWIMEGIEDAAYGRYLIQDGRIEKIAELDKSTCMSEPQTLQDFITWGVESYPADRRMLIFWDHGGGLSSGYGMDDLNPRETETKREDPTLSVSEICDAIQASGTKFDIIGFDACLMQNIEIAAAFEPYADYFLASEEAEGGYGWFYTSPFGMLAQNPSMSSLDFGREMIACYDPYNEVFNDGEPDTSATLSFVDLPRAKAAYESMDGLFSGAQAAIAKDTKSFANISLAGTKSYQFTGKEQVDLIDFLERLSKLDYNDEILSNEKIAELENAVKACVVFRNAASAEGVNGMAFSFPVESTETYSKDYDQLKHFSFDSQNKMMADFFSIMAVQKKREHDAFDPETAGFFDKLSHSFYTDYTKEEWYVNGFEDYDNTPVMLDIPLKEVEGGYQIQAPEDLWSIVADVQLAVYQKAEDGLMRYLGHDQVAAYGEDGHPLVAMGGTWVHVGDKLCCYEAGQPRETETGTVFTGTTKARLNGSTDITIYIEWNEVPEGEEGFSAGRILGYTLNEGVGESEGLEGEGAGEGAESEGESEGAEDEDAENEGADDEGADDKDGLSLFDNLFTEEAADETSPRGKLTFSPGDRVEFLFDYYDEEGNMVKTEAYGGALLVTEQERIVVEDKELGTCDVEFYGVLTDVYQRTMSTEKIEAHID